jgi:hypothetical protein
VGGTGGSNRTPGAFSSVFALRIGSVVHYLRHNPGVLAELLSLWLQLALTDLRLKLLPWSLNRSFVFPKEESFGSISNPESGLSSVPVPGPSDGRKLTEAEGAEVARLTRQVARAARFHAFFTMSCLRRSLVLRSRLAKAGIPARLVFGTSRRAGDSFRSFTGHAWLDVCGMVVDSYGSAPSRVAFSSPGSRIRSSGGD